MSCVVRRSVDEAWAVAPSPQPLMCAKPPEPEPARSLFADAAPLSVDAIQMFADAPQH